MRTQVTILASLMAVLGYGLLLRAGDPGDKPIALPKAGAATQPVATLVSMPSPVKFRKVTLDKVFRSEGVAVADVNHDGKVDILAGEVWYQAPDWKMHEIAPPGKHDPAGGYSNCFANFAMSVRGDGWMDSLVVGFPGKECFWYENPRGKEGPWKKHLICKSACNETPLFADLLGSGKKVLVFPTNGTMTWFSVPKDPEQLWDAHAISQPKASGTDIFSHGLGVGDVNGDGRNDVLTTAGWWAAPSDRASGQPPQAVVPASAGEGPWEFHKANFGPACANLLVYDVDGDGLNDIITSSAHNVGIWWFQQAKTDKGVEWKQHEIAKLFTQSHAMILDDINGDELKDIVVGKRFWAHGPKGDPGSDQPAVLYWFELRRPEKGKAQWIPHLIDEDSGVGTQFEVFDINGDGKLDIAVSNKKGVFVFLQE